MALYICILCISW